MRKLIKRLFCKHKRAQIHFGNRLHYAQCIDCGKRKELNG